MRLEKAYRERGCRRPRRLDRPRAGPARSRSSWPTNRPDFPNYRKKSGGDDQDFIESVDPKWGGELPFTVLYGPDGRKAKVLSGKQSYADFERAVAGLLK